MLLYILIPVLGIVLDPAVTYWAANSLQPIGSIPLWEGVFHLTYCENTGAAFSMFTGQRWPLLVVTVILLGGMIYVLRAGWMQNLFGEISLLLMITGAVGNMIDRIVLGYVVDLFDFCLIDFAIFNVADIFLCVAVGMMCIYVLFMEPKIEKAKKEAAQNGDHHADGNA